MDTERTSTGAAYGAADGARIGGAEDFREQAERCRRLSSSALDRRTLDALESMAREYDAKAAGLDGAE